MEHEHPHIKDRPDRWHNAACFRSKLLTASQTGWIDTETCDFWQTPCNPETLGCTLTPDDILTLYHNHRDYAKDMYPGEGRDNFDLQDVYIITQDHLHMRHQWGRDYEADSPDAVSNERYIRQVESILDVIGQVISTG